MRSATFSVIRFVGQAILLKNLMISGFFLLLFLSHITEMSQTDGLMPPKKFSVFRPRNFIFCCCKSSVAEPGAGAAGAATVRVAP